MQAMVTMRPTHGLMFSATYTWSKSMGYNGISDYRDRDIDYGLSGGRAHALIFLWHVRSALRTQSLAFL